MNLSLQEAAEWALENSADISTHTEQAYIGCDGTLRWRATNLPVMVTHDRLHGWEKVDPELSCEACGRSDRVVTMTHPRLCYECSIQPKPQIEEWPIEWQMGGNRAKAPVGDDWINLAFLDSIEIYGTRYRLLDFKYEKDGQVWPSRATALAYNGISRLAHEITTGFAFVPDKHILLSPVAARMLRE